MKKSRWRRGFAIEFALLALAACSAAPAAQAQGTRRDDIVFGPQGRPWAGALVAVCTQPASTSTPPCSPLANIFNDAALTQPATNPIKTDGLGNYHFYAAPGRYTIEVYGPQLNTTVLPDVILPNDPMNPTVSTITSSGSVSAFSLTLNGNLTVGGNASVTGSLSTGSFNPSAIATNTLSTKGPQPRIDVTGYSAKGDGTTDDTAAIQAAINSACSSSSNGGGTVYFPPSNNITGIATSYKVLQPQTPSTSPVFTIPAGCVGLHLQGGNSFGGTSNQFSRAPQTRIISVPGTSPNLAPVFLIGNNQTAITFENLAITGYNQAIQMIDTAGHVLQNVSLAVSHTGQALGGTTDNCDLAIYNSFWIWYEQGSMVVSNPNDYSVVIANISGGTQPNLGLLRFERVTSTGAYLYDQRTPENTSSGNITFQTVAVESSTLPFLTFTNTGGSGPYFLSQVDLQNVDNFDCSGTPANQPVVLVNAGASSRIEDVNIWNASSCSGPASPLVLVQSGSVNGLHVVGGAELNRMVVDGSGNPIGPALQNNISGWDMIANTNDATRLRTDLYNGCCSASGSFNGTGIRMTQTGKKLASLGIDPAQGVLFSDAASPGYNAQFNQTVSNAIDVGFSQAVPPANLAGAPATGGSCAAGTYYYKAAAYTPGTFLSSGASLDVPVTLSGANNAVNVTWTASVGTNVGGYYIYRSPTALNYGVQPLYQVIGGGATSFTDACGAPTASAAPAVFNNTLARTNRFDQGKLRFTEGACANPVAGEDILCANSASHQLFLSNNGAAFTAIGSGGGGVSLTEWISQPNQAGSALSPQGVNTIIVSQIVIHTGLTFSKVMIDVSAIDATNNYDIGIYDAGGNLKCNIGAQHLASGGVQDKTCAQGLVTLSAGTYYFAWTGNATTATIFYAGGSGLEAIGSNTSGTASSGGALPSTISLPGAGATTSVFFAPFIILH